MSAIKNAIKEVGSQSELARRCGVQPQAVQQWKNSGSVPPKRVLQIEAATSGKVTRHELRPDIYPLPVPDIQLSLV